MRKLILTKRSGFTLIEMLVVVGLVALLASLTVAVIPSSDNRACARAADQLQGWIAGAKNRAIRDQSTRGVRLVSKANINGTFDPHLISEIQYLEQPEVYQPRNERGTAANVVIFKYPLSASTNDWTFTFPQPSNPGGYPPIYSGVAYRGPSPLAAHDNRTLRGCYVARISGIGQTEMTALFNFNGSRAFDRGDVMQVNIGTNYNLKIEAILQGPTINGKQSIDVYLAPGQYDLTDYSVSPPVVKPAASFKGRYQASPGQLDPDILGFSPVSTDSKGSYPDPDGISVVDTNHVDNPGTANQIKYYVKRVNLKAGECRIIRTAKPVIGEQPLLLPKNVVIDMTLSYPFQATAIATTTATTTASTYYDILFGAGGQVLGRTQPRINLWVRSLDDGRWIWPDPANSTANVFKFDATKKAGAGAPTIISISTRTGNVSAHPVDQTSTGTPATWNPYRFLEDGKGDSGM